MMVNGMRLRFGRILGMGLSLFVTGAVSADSVTAHLDSVTPYLNVGVQFDGLVGSGGAVNGTEIAGLFNWTTVSSTPSGLTEGNITFNPGTQFNTFCIELNQNVTIGGPNYVYTVGSLTGAPTNGPTISSTAALFITELWEKHF
jgi:hypothetical protein